MKPIVFVALLLLCTPAFTRAEEPALSPASDLDTTLDALNARGQNLKDFTADVVLHTADNRTGEDVAQIGSVIFQNRPNGDSRIKVGFDKKESDNGNGPKITQKQKLNYLLENGWLTDRDYQKKLEVRRQVLQPGQKMNLLKLGEGPFPLPIGQDKTKVKKQFETSKVLAAADDPKDTVHIKLVPKSGSQFEKRFKQIDVFVDTKTGMPARIDTVEKAGTTRSTELKNVKLNIGVKDAAFVLPPIANDGWNRREEPFG